MRIWGHGPWHSAPGRERRSVCLAGLGRFCGLCQVAVAGWLYSYMAGVEDADVWWWSGSGSGRGEWCILRWMVPTSIVIILIVDHLALRVFPSFSLFQHRRYHLFYSSILLYSPSLSPYTDLEHRHSHTEDGSPGAGHSERSFHPVGSSLIKID
jgi:hypothetical protein